MSYNYCPNDTMMMMMIMMIIIIISHLIYPKVSSSTLLTSVPARCRLAAFSLPPLNHLPKKKKKEKSRCTLPPLTPL